MKLAIITDDGQVFVCSEELESFDLSKAPAQCVLLADIKNEMERIAEYEGDNDEF